MLRSGKVGKGGDVKAGPFGSDSFLLQGCSGRLFTPELEGVAKDRGGEPLSLATPPISGLNSEGREPHSTNGVSGAGRGRARALRAASCRVISALFLENWIAS